MTPFDALMERYALWDYCVWVDGFGFLRDRCYHDGGWLEGYALDPIIYWGA